MNFRVIFSTTSEVFLSLIFQALKRKFFNLKKRNFIVFGGFRSRILNELSNKKVDFFYFYGKTGS